MAFSRNFGVNQRNRLCGVQEHAFAKFLDFFELAENCTFLDRKLTSALNKPWTGTSLLKIVKMASKIKAIWFSTGFLEPPRTYA
jgi:hypothetical protein